MSKPFFYRLNASDFFAVVRELTDKECAKWLRTFSSDLVAGNTKNEYTQSLIDEAKKYKENKSLAGKKGMENRYRNTNNDTTVLGQKDNKDITKNVITRNNSSSSNNSSNNEIKEKLLLPSEAFQLFQKYAGVAQIGGGQAAMIKELVALYSRETIEEAFRAAASANISVHGFLNWSRKRMERQPEAPQESASDRMLRELEEEESRGK